MKSFFVAAAIATIAVVNAADCDVTKLAAAVASASATQCTADSTYTFVPPAAPSADILPKICASTACQKVLADVKALGLGDCAITLVTPPVQLEAFLKSFTDACASASGAASTGSGAAAPAGSSSSAGAGVATVTTPVPAAADTTTAPAASSNSSSTTTSTPTPSATTSAASAVTLASSAVVLAAAAAFM